MDANVEYDPNSLKEIEQIGANVSGRKLAILKFNKEQVSIYLRTRENLKLPVNTLKW